MRVAIGELYTLTEEPRCDGMAVWMPFLRISVGHFGRMFSAACKLRAVFHLAAWKIWPKVG